MGTGTFGPVGVQPCSCSMKGVINSCTRGVLMYCYTVRKAVSPFHLFSQVVPKYRCTTVQDPSTCQTNRHLLHAYHTQPGKTDLDRVSALSTVSDHSTLRGHHAQRRGRGQRHEHPLFDHQDGKIEPVGTHLCVSSYHIVRPRWTILVH